MPLSTMLCARHLTQQILKQSYFNARTKSKHCRQFHQSPSSYLNYDPKDPRLNFITVKSHGGSYNVGYLDEGPPDGTTVLAIHGAPGGATDFDSIIDKLTENGARVVIPNLPGNYVTVRDRSANKSKFDYTTRHRAEFICNFMEAVKLDSCVDLIMGHSLGGPVTIRIAADMDRVRGVALFNTVGYRPHKHIRPYWLTQAYFRSLGIPGLGYLFKQPLVKIYQKRGFRIEDMDYLVSGLAVAAGLDFKQAKLDAEAIRARNLPVFSATCKNDLVVDWFRGLELAQLAADHEKATTFFDKDENIVEGPHPDVYIPSRSLVFEKGGHFSYKNHVDIVVKGLVDLINHVKRRS